MSALADFTGNDIFIDSNIFIFNATVTGPYEECEKFLLKNEAPNPEGLGILLRF